MVYYDLDKEAWRSFRSYSFIKILNIKPVDPDAIPDRRKEDEEEEARKKAAAKAKEAEEKERRLQEAMLDIRKKYGRNMILKGMNLREGATGRERNKQIGGHRS